MAEPRNLEALRAERDDLLRSIEDLERERAAADIDDDDFDRLRSDYVARTSAVQRAISAAESLPAGAQQAAGSSRWARFRRMLGRRRTRRALLLATVVWFLAAVAVAGLHAAGVRLPGESATGSVTLSQAMKVEQELAQASSLAASGQVAQAISVYGTVLETVPHQHEALTYQGWLIRLSGLAAHDATVIRRGDREIAEAVRVAPRYPDARGLDAVALFEDGHDAHAAIAQLVACIRDHPSTSFVRAVRSKVLPIYRAANLSPPKLFS